MPTVRAHNIAMSLDGYVAGPNQSLDHPLGEGGMQLHQFVFVENPPDVDQEYIAQREVNAGATIMGRNMFGPIRGEWAESEWRGWWGPNPPYHHPVFVLTHHAHDPIEMDGGTTFHFVTGGIESAYEQAVAAAGDADVIIGGGASTVRQYLRAGLVDWLHVPVVPVLLGGGERLFESAADLAGYRVTQYRPSPAVAHMIIEKG